MSLPPERKTELFYNGVWNDISGDMRDTSAVTITRGRNSESSRADPSAASMVVDNREGKYSPRDPESPLYGLIGRNTPIRHSVFAGGAWAEFAGGNEAFTTPDNAAQDITTDIDIRVEFAPNDWLHAYELAAKYETVGENRSWGLMVTAEGKILFFWTSAGTFASRISTGSTIAIPAYNGQRIAIRVTLDVNNGAGGNTSTFYYSNSIDGVWRQLGEPTTLTGTTSVFNGTAPLEVGSIEDISDFGLVGKMYAFQLWNGIDGVKVVDLDFSVADPGDTTVTDNTGFLWTARSTASLSNEHVRIEGEVPAWPPERDLSGNDRYTSIAPTGIMRRLDAGVKPIDSSILRFIKRNNPAECWPMTDGAQSRVATSIVPGGRSMTQRLTFGTANVQWSKGEIAEWIEPVAMAPHNTDGFLVSNRVATTGVVDETFIEMLRRGTGDGDYIILTDTGAGTPSSPRTSLRLDFNPGTNSVSLTVTFNEGETSSVALLSNITSAGIFDDQPHIIRLMVRRTAFDLPFEIYIDGVLRDSDSHGVPLTGNIKEVRYGWDLDGVTSGAQSFGYLTMWEHVDVSSSEGEPPSAEEMYQAMLGFPGERAGERALRVATEAGVTLSGAGIAEIETRMGSQSREKLLDALDQCAKSDVGFLGERRDARELIFQSHGVIYNQAPLLTLDFSAGVISAPFKPTDDDRYTENDVTVQRERGGFGIGILEEGSMSIQEPPLGVGRYDSSYTRSLEDDDQPEQLANWLMALGTFNGLRYKQITLDLGNPRVYAMVDDILRLDVGDLIRITNLPDAYGPDPVDLLIQGYSEEIGPSAWKITFTCSPGEPWATGFLDGGFKLGSTVTKLAGDHTNSTTNMNIETPVSSTRWAESAAYPSDYPSVFKVGGETVQATACISFLKDAFGRTVANGWGTSDSNKTWSTGGGTAADYAVGSGYGSHTLASVAISRRTFIDFVATDFDGEVSIAVSTTATGAALFGGLTARHTSGDNLYHARLIFNTSGSLQLDIRKRVSAVESAVGSTFTPGITYVAGTFYRLRFQVEGTTLRAKVWRVTDNEPGAWHIEATDSSLSASPFIGIRSISGSGNTNVNAQVRYDNLDVNNVQSLTVVRSVNGIVKAHADDEPIDLLNPIYVSL